MWERRLTNGQISLAPLLTPIANGTVQQVIHARARRCHIGISDDVLGIDLGLGGDETRRKSAAADKSSVLVLILCSFFVFSFKYPVCVRRTLVPCVGLICQMARGASTFFFAFLNHG